MRFSTIIPLLICAMCNLNSTAFAQALEIPDRPEVFAGRLAAQPVLSNTPEAALRIFMIAMLSGDTEKLTQVANPNDDIERLMPKDRLPECLTAGIRASWETRPVKRLKVGETLTYSNSQSKVIDGLMINENKALLLLPDCNATFGAVLDGETWKIDPRNIGNVSVNYN